MFTVKITPNEKGNPPGKLADAELHFTDPTCPDCQGDRELTVADSGPLAAQAFAELRDERVDRGTTLHGRHEVRDLPVEHSAGRS